VDAALRRSGDARRWIVSAPLQVVAVGSAAEEAALLGELSRWRRSPAPFVAPVPADPAAVAAMELLARRCGRGVVPSRAGALAERTPRRVAAGPSLVLAGRGVDERLTALASVLCGARVGSFDDVTAGRSAIESGDRALVLWNQAGSPFSATRAVLTALASQRARFGLIPCDDPALAREFLVRTLSFPEIPDRGRTAVISEAFDPRGRPTCLHGPDSSVAELVRSDLDLLVIHGHGNALDLDLGPSAILCARAAGTGSGEAGVFPCFQPGGTCFRQVRAHANAELIDPRSLDALLLVTVSCHIVHLGPSAFSSRASILPALLASGMVAAITTTGAAGMGPELVTLALGLLREGRPLGDVARLLNEFHAAHGIATGLDPAYTPFVVIGNPCARLAAAIPQARVVQRRAGAVTARVTSDLAADPAGTLLRIPLESTDLPGATIATASGVKGTDWQKVVVLGRGRDRAAYAWLGPKARLERRTIRLESRPADELVQVRTLQAAADRLRVWETMLDWYLEEFAWAPTRVPPVERLLLGVVRLQRHLASIAVALREGRAPPDFFHAGLAHLASAGGQLLAICADVANTMGLPDLGARTGMSLTGEPGEAGPCACGDAVLRCQSYAAPGGGELLRLMCPCGDAGQQSAGTPASMVPTTRRVRRGEIAHLALRCTAPADRFLFAQGIAVLEPWLDKRPVHGAIADLVVDPAATADLECPIRIPRRVAPGVYPMSVIAVIDGGLVHRKTMFRVER
jgi:hypothetical protein